MLKCLKSLEIKEASPDTKLMEVVQLESDEEREDEANTEQISKKLKTEEPIEDDIVLNDSESSIEEVDETKPKKR